MNRLLLYLKQELRTSTPYDVPNVDHVSKITTVFRKLPRRTTGIHPQKQAAIINCPLPPEQILRISKTEHTLVLPERTETLLPIDYDHNIRRKRDRWARISFHSWETIRLVSWYDHCSNSLPLYSRRSGMFELSCSLFGRDSWEQSLKKEFLIKLMLSKRFAHGDKAEMSTR